LVSGPDLPLASESLLSAAKPALWLAAGSVPVAADVLDDAVFWANARASLSFCASTSRSLNSCCFSLKDLTDVEEGLMSPIPGALDCCIAVELRARTPERGAAAATRVMVRQNMARAVVGGKGGIGLEGVVVDGTGGEAFGGGKKESLGSDTAIDGFTPGRVQDQG
jgi:hypothetical protein